MSGRAASRLGDKCSGHSCFPMRPIVTASNNVFVNGIGSARKDDMLTVHCCKSSCHSGSISQASNTVFINGRAAARIGDSVDCGSILAQGSANVFVG